METKYFDLREKIDDEKIKEAAEAIKEGKLVYTWDVTYHEEKEEFVFFTKDYLNPIIFEMPKTGNKKTFSSELILILLFIIKRIKG